MTCLCGCAPFTSNHLFPRHQSRIKKSEPHHPSPSKFIDNHPYLPPTFILRDYLAKIRPLSTDFLRALHQPVTLSYNLLAFSGLAFPPRPRSWKKRPRVSLIYLLSLLPAIAYHHQQPILLLYPLIPTEIFFFDLPALRPLRTASDTRRAS